MNNKQKINQPFIFNQNIFPNKYNLYYNPYKYNFKNDTIINILNNIHILQDTFISRIELKYIIYNCSYNDNIFQYKSIQDLYKIKDLSIFNNINYPFNQPLLNIIVKNYIIFKRLQFYQNYLLIYYKFNLENNLLITKTIDIIRENIINNIFKYEQKK